MTHEQAQGADSAPQRIERLSVAALLLAFAGMMALRMPSLALLLAAGSAACSLRARANLRADPERIGFTGLVVAFVIALLVAGTVVVPWFGTTVFALPGP